MPLLIVLLLLLAGCAQSGDKSLPGEQNEVKQVARIDIKDVPVKPIEENIGAQHAKLSREDVLIKLGQAKAEDPENFEKNNLNGGWNWFALTKGGESTNRGAITFKDLEDGKLSGHVYVQVPIKKGAKRSYEVHRFRLNGSKEKTNEGKVKIYFVTKSYQGKYVTANEAVLSEDGNRLDARATVRSPGSDDEETYQWIAYRYGTMEMPDKQSKKQT